MSGEQTPRTSRLRGATCFFGIVALLLATGALIAGGPRIARRLWISRNVDADVRARWQAIQEKLDEGGAWGTNDQARRFAKACLVSVKDQQRCEACVADFFRSPNGRRVIHIYIREDGDEPFIGQRYKDRIQPLIIGDDPNGTWDVKKLDIYIEGRRNGRLSGYYQESIERWWHRYGGAGDESSVGAAVGGGMTDTMNIELRRCSPTPTLLPAADVGPVESWD